MRPKCVVSAVANAATMAGATMQAIPRVVPGSPAITVATPAASATGMATEAARRAVRSLQRVSAVRRDFTSTLIAIFSAHLSGEDWNRFRADRHACRSFGSWLIRPGR